MPRTPEMGIDMRARQRVVGAGLLLGGLIFGAPIPGAAQESPLPEAVQTWMERDQVQRWAQMIAEGDSLFNSNSCQRCHGTAGSGGRNGPDLTDDTWVQSDGSLEGIRRSIFWGVRRELFAGENWRFEMNPGGGVDLEWNQYASLAAYVWSLSNGTFLPN